MKSKTKKNNAYEKIANLTNNNTLDMPLLIVVLILLGFGIVMVLSASAPSALADFNDSYQYVKRQGISAILGIIVMYILSKYNSTRFKKFYKIIYILSVLVLFTVLIPSIGVETNGARRWIKLGMQLQPSELTKIGLIIAFAGYFSDPKNKLDKLWDGCLKPIIFLIIPVAILYKVQNHLSAGIVISAVTFIMIIMSGCQMKYIGYLICMGIGGGGIALLAFKDKLSNGFRTDRVEAWLDPFANPRGTGYQTIQSLYAIGSGGLFGVGLGESKQK